MISLPLRAKTAPTADQAGRPMPRKADRVLIIKLGALGDFVQALAAVKLIRDYHIGARITLLTTEPFEAFAKACPYFDVVEADGRPRDATATAQLVQRLRAGRFDIVYDLQTSGRSSNYFMGLQPRPPLWSGIAPNCSHPHANPQRETMHTLDRLNDQLVFAGIAKPRPIGEAPLPVVSWVRTALRDPPRLQPGFFGVKQPFGLIIPGASAHRPEKRWPAEAYAALAGKIADRGVAPLVIGHKDEQEAATLILKLEPRAKSAVMRTDLFQVTALAERAAFAVGNDTGPMHIAAAAGTRCVVLFGPDSDPAKVCPRGRAGVVSIQGPSLEDLSVGQVDQMIANLGGYAQNA
jgi:ADP-heptose:LPS heptosyltransferase